MSASHGTAHSQLRILQPLRKPVVDERQKRYLWYLRCLAGTGLGQHDNDIMLAHGSCYILSKPPHWQLVRLLRLHHADDRPTPSDVLFAEHAGD